MLQTFANKFPTFYVNLSRNKFVFKWNELHAVSKKFELFQNVFHSQQMINDSDLTAPTIFYRKMENVAEQFILESNIPLPFHARFNKRRKRFLLTSSKKNPYFEPKTRHSDFNYLLFIDQNHVWGHFRGIHRTSINHHLFPFSNFDLRVYLEPSAVKGE